MGGFTDAVSIAGLEFTPPPISWWYTRSNTRSNTLDATLTVDAYPRVFRASTLRRFPELRSSCGV
jgi:hypothetical protein